MLSDLLRLMLPQALTGFFEKSVELGDISNSLQKIHHQIELFFDESKIVNQIFHTTYSEIPEIVDLRVLNEEVGYRVEVFLEENDWEAEERIYEKYLEILNESPSFSFEVHINHLYGKSPGKLLQHIVD